MYGKYTQIKSDSLHLNHVMHNMGSKWPSWVFIFYIFA